jgi:hypothetical protein
MKAAVLALSAPSRAWVDLAPAAVREAFGTDPDEHQLASLRFDVLAALCRLEAEITMGRIGPAPVVVRGRPLGDWLDLADVARLLRTWRRSPRA